MRVVHPGVPAALALTLAMASIPAQAIEVHGGWETGLGAMREALGNFKPEAPGVGAGLYLIVDLGGGHLLRPKVSDWLFSRRQLMGDPNAPLLMKHNAELASLSMDYVYIPGGSPSQGYYLMAGAGVSRNRMGLDLPVPGSEGASMFHVSGASTQPVYDLGWGYQWNSSVGTEVRFEHSHWVSPVDQAGTQTFNINALKGTLTFRF